MGFTTTPHPPGAPRSYTRNTRPSTTPGKHPATHHPESTPALRNTSPESIPAYRDTAPRRHPTTTCDEAPGRRGIVLNPTFTWGTTIYVNKKGSESRRRDPTTPTSRHITRKHPRIPRHSARRHPHTTTRDTAPGGRGIVLNPTFTWGLRPKPTKKARRAVVVIPRHQPRDTSPESIHTPRPATKRPEGAGSCLTPRLRGGYDQSQQKRLGEPSS